ncbi:MAG: hypothetical protein ABUK08_03275 [Candidatus Humimicrobiaceae bacterium]
MRHIYKYLNNKQGNVFLLVLIITFAAIFLITAMVQFLFRDVGLIEVDEGELKALNIAEAGLSNWYLKFDKFSAGEDPDFEFDDSYTENVYEDGDIVGTFTVDYSPDIENEWQYTPFGYSVVSGGTDIESGFTRTVRVRLISLDLYDFIFSEEAMGSAQIAGNTNITGPLFVVGDFGMVTGDSIFQEGPLFVLGDIIVAGSSQIGAPDWPILLFMGGKMYENNGPEVDPIDPPGNVEVYVAEFHNIMIDISLPEIDEAYLNEVRGLGGVLEINGDLYIGDEELEIIGPDAGKALTGYLEFLDGTLNINGNIIVSGDINIGKPAPKYTIEYDGHANLIATGNINAYSRIIPEDWYSFPETSLITLITQQNIYLDMTTAQGGSGENDPNIAAMVISNNAVETTTGTVLTGSSVSHELILGQGSKMFYRYGIGEFLGPAVPQFNDLLLVYSWQEIINPE